jgi:hypothetical protein
MDESALKTLLDSLENSRSSLGSWLDFWTFLVVLGVIIEVAFVVWEYVEKLRDFKRGEVHPPEKPSKVRFVLELLGAAFVAIGVAGELYIDAKIGTVETEIRSANDRRASLLSKEAGAAKTSAEDAASAASRANDEAGQAIAKSNAVKIASGEAMNRSNAADKAASEALTRIGTVKWYVDILAKTVNPRMLDRKFVLDALAGKPRGAAAIWYEPNDPEASFLATQIHTVLGPKGAGWQVEDTKPLSEAWNSNNFVYGERMSPLDEERIEANLNSVGVTVTGNKFSELDIEGKTTFGALTRAIMLGTGEHHFGIAFSSTTDPTLPDDHFVIVVGHHRANVPLLTAPWQNTPPLPTQARPKTSRK